MSESQILKLRCLRVHADHVRTELRAHVTGIMGRAVPNMLDQSDYYTSPIHFGTRELAYFEFHFVNLELINAINTLAFSGIPMTIDWRDQDDSSVHYEKHYRFSDTGALLCKHFDTSQYSVRISGLMELIDDPEALAKRIRVLDELTDVLPFDDQERNAQHYKLAQALLVEAL